MNGSLAPAGLLDPGLDGFPPRRARAALLGGAVGLAVPVLLLAVRACGVSIPQPAIESDYVVAVAWALVLGLGILAWPVPRRDREALLILWAARCAVTLLFMLPYERHYLLDAFGYFGYARMTAFPTATTLPDVSGGTAVVVRLAWLHNQLFPASYHALKVSFSMVGLVAVYLCYRAARLASPRTGLRFLYLLGFFPSVLFWSSILGKDPLVLLGISLYALGAVAIARRGGHGAWLLAGVGIALAASVRVWLAPILLLPLALPALLRIHGVVRRLAMLLVLGAAFALAIRLFADTFRLSVLSDVYSLLEGMSQSGGWDGGSSSGITLQLRGPLDVIAFLPYGIFSALFRPLPGEVRNPFGLLAGLENAVLLLLALQALWRMRLRALRDPVVAWATLFVFTWSAVYGFISVLNFGAGARFKLQVLPVLLALLLHLRSRTQPNGSA